MEKKVIVEAIHEPIPESTFCGSSGSQTKKQLNGSHEFLKSSIGQSPLTISSTRATTPCRTITVTGSTSSRGEQVAQVAHQWAAVNWKGLQRTSVFRRTSLCPLMSFENLPNLKENHHQGPSNVSKIVEPLDLHANLKRKTFAQCPPPKPSKAPKYLKVYKKNLIPKVDVPMKNAPCSSSVENYIKMDTLEKGAEVLDHLDDAAYSGLIKNVMDVTNARHGDYLEKGIKTYLGEKMYMQIASSILELDPLGGQFHPNNPSSPNESLLSSSKLLQNSNIKQLVASNKKLLKQDSSTKPIGNRNLILNPKGLEMRAKEMFNFDDNDRCSLNPSKGKASRTVIQGILDEDTSINENTFGEVDKIIADKISWMRDHNYSNNETVTFKIPDFDPVMPENIFESLEVIMEDRKLTVSELEELAFESDQILETETLNSHESAIATSQIPDTCNVQQPLKLLNGNPQDVLKPNVFKESVGEVGDRDTEQRKLQLLLKRVQRESLGQRRRDTCVADKTSLTSYSSTVQSQDESATSSKEVTNIVEKIDKEIPLSNEIYVSNNTKNISVKVPNKNGEMTLTSNISPSKLKKTQPGKRSFPAKVIKFESHVKHEQTASVKYSESKLINHKEMQETENRTSCLDHLLRPTKANPAETCIGNKTDTINKFFQSDKRDQSSVKFTSPEETSCKMQNLQRPILKDKSLPIAVELQDVQENSNYKDWELKIKQNRIEGSQSVKNDTTKRPDPWQKEYLQRLLILGDLEPNPSENTGKTDLEPLEKDLRVINVELGPPMEVDSIMQMSGKNAAPGRDSAICQSSNAQEEEIAKDQGNTVCVLLMGKPPLPDFTITGTEIVGSKVEIKAIVCKLEQPLGIKEPLNDNSLRTKEPMPRKNIQDGTEEPDSSSTERKIVGFNIQQPLDLKVSPPNVFSGVLESMCQRHITKSQKLATTIDENEKKVDGHFELPLEVKVPPILDSSEKVPQDSVKTNKGAIPFDIHREVGVSMIEPTLEVNISLSQENIVDKVITNLPFETDEKEISRNLELPLEGSPNTLDGREMRSDKAICSLNTKESAPGNSSNLTDNVPPKNCVKTGKLELPRKINRNVIGSKLETLNMEMSRSENCLRNLKKIPQSNVVETDMSNLLLDDKVHFPDSSLKEENCVGTGRRELPNEINLNLTESQLEALEVNLLSSENTLRSLEKMLRENFVTVDESELHPPENSLSFLENCANAKITELPIGADAKIQASKLELSSDVKASSPDNTVATTVTTPEEVATEAETGKGKSKTGKESSFLTANAPIEKTTVLNPSDDVEQSMVELNKLLSSFENVKELRLKGPIRNNLFESFAQKLSPALHNGRSVNDLAQLLMDFQQSSFDTYLEEKCTIYSAIFEEKDRVRVDDKEASDCLVAKSNGENGKAELAGSPKLSPIQQASEEVMEEPEMAKSHGKPAKRGRKGNKKTLSSNNFKRQRARKLCIQTRRNLLKQQISKLSSRIRIRIKRVQGKYRQFRTFVRRINLWLAISSMDSFDLQQKVQHLRHVSHVVDKTLMAFKTADIAKLEAKFRRMLVMLSGRRISSPAKIKRNLRRVTGKYQNGLEQELAEDGGTLKPVSGGDLGESLVKRQLKMYINRKKRAQVAADRLADQMSKTSHSNCVIDAAPASPAAVVIDKPSMDQLMPESPKPLFGLEQDQDQTTGYGLKSDIRESEALRNAPKGRKRQCTSVSHRYSLRSSTSGIGSRDLQRST